MDPGFELPGQSMVDDAQPLDCQKGTNTSLAAPGALAYRLQRRTACNAAPRASGPQNGRRGLERCLPLGFGALPSTFAK